MPDITSISAALSSLNTASELVKVIRSSGVTLKDAEIKLKLAELIESLADAKIEISEIQGLLQSKQREIDELQSKLEIQENLIWDAPYYWLGPKENENGPYCQNCYDDKSKLIRLQEGITGSWNCMTCDSNYRDDNYRPPGMGMGGSRSIPGF